MQLIFLARGTTLMISLFILYKHHVILEIFNEKEKNEDYQIQFNLTIKEDIALMFEVSIFTPHRSKDC